jgi:hypothetical protein
MPLREHHGLSSSTNDHDDYGQPCILNVTRQRCPSGSCANEPKMAEINVLNAVKEQGKEVTVKDQWGINEGHISVQHKENTHDRPGTRAIPGPGSSNSRRPEKWHMCVSYEPTRILEYSPRLFQRHLTSQKSLSMTFEKESVRATIDILPWRRCTCEAQPHRVCKPTFKRYRLRTPWTIWASGVVIFEGGRGQSSA